VRSEFRAPLLLFALLVAAFITFYPQLDAAGYCGDGGCPEVSYPGHAGAASGGAVTAGVSFVVAALVAVPGILCARPSRLTLQVPPPGTLLDIFLSPETPPPQPLA
jgi:hypothetical protein